MKMIAALLSKKNPLLLGFTISLMGALPLGYINIISLQVLLEQGNWASLSFISGIIFIQYFVLRAINKMAVWLVNQEKLLRFIDIFTILFLFTIALYFMTNIANDKNTSLSVFKLSQYPFLLALFLNLLNFIQWPYWSGIYIYLFRTSNLESQKSTNTTFILGALLGTIAGMFLFAHIGEFLIKANQVQISSYINPFFMLLFLFLASAQTIKFVFKKKSLPLKIANKF
jgi:hypothetical protein